MTNKPLGVLGILTGPTASGKTALSIALAKRLNAEIVSADSIQIYRGLDIGSAKPTQEEMQGIPHHLISAVDIDSPKFSVAEYQKLALSAINDIVARGKFPLVVGGTGLYINALTYPLNFTSVPADEAYRAELLQMEEKQPGSAYEALKRVDPASARRLHPNDKKRIIRALEVYHATGSTIGEFGAGFSSRADDALPYEVRMAGLCMPRAMLYERINARVEQMMRQGLLEEVRAILDNGYDTALPALQGLGYKQLIAYFEGKYSLDEAVERIKMETRRFAKRQITWFKRDERIRWFDVSMLSQEALLDELESVMRCGGRAT